MKHIYLNLKRFDVPKEMGGVNVLAPVDSWAETIVKGSEEGLKSYDPAETDFAMFFPEAHLLGAVRAQGDDSPIKIGSQSVYRGDTAVGGNFGAFTTNLTANAAAAIGCTATIIGHCEERKDKFEVLAEAGVNDTAAINRLLNKSVRCAVDAGLDVLYCIGEKAEEQEHWKEVLREQLETGLEDVHKSRIVIA